MDPSDPWLPPAATLDDASAGDAAALERAVLLRRAADDALPELHLTGAARQLLSELAAEVLELRLEVELLREDLASRD